MIRALPDPETVTVKDEAAIKAKKGRKAVVKWRKCFAADGYQLYYKAKGVKAKKVIINSGDTLQKTVKKLKAGGKYTFKIRSFTKVDNLAEPGTTKNVYGRWSKGKRVKAKK